MAKGKKTGGRNIQPGQVLNPTGRPKMPEELRTVKQLSPQILRAIIDKLSSLPLSQIQAMRETGLLGILEETVISIWLRAVAEGDQARLNFILDRSRIGKVQDKIDLTVGTKTVYVTTMAKDGKLLQDMLKPEEDDLSSPEEDDLSCLLVES